LEGGAANAVAARVGEDFLVLTRVLLVKRKDGKQETKKRRVMRDFEHHTAF
jgi:hypothetical protein